MHSIDRLMASLLDRECREVLARSRNAFLRSEPWLTAAAIVHATSKSVHVTVHASIHDDHCSQHRQCMNADANKR